MLNPRCHSVSVAGDINGDGFDDLIIGATEAAAGVRRYTGASYVVFGRDVVQAGAFPATFGLASLLPENGGDGSEGFVVNGVDAYDFSGISVHAAGDVNGDGIDDLIIGAYRVESAQADETYVVFGRDTAQAGAFPAAFELVSLEPENGGDGSGGFVLNRTTWIGSGDR